MKKKLLIFLCCIGVYSVGAQNLVVENFQQLLLQAKLNYIAPLEQSYKVIPVEKNDFHVYEYAIRSKSKDLEIRYSIESIEEDKQTSDIPHIKCFSLVNTLADNQQDQAIAVHNISAKDLSEKYNADWGAIIYFRPKSAFSTKSHCKMLSLFAEGKADVYIFYLFDEPSKEVDQQQYTLRFVED